MRKLLKILLWLLAFTPLVVDKSVFYPSVTGESFFLRSILFFVSLLFISYFFYKKSFRNEISEKISNLIKNPLIISVCAFLFIIIFSTIFAVDKYVAFWGNLARGEGLVGIMYFFSFFVFSLLILEKKDWLWFFRLSLFTTLILLIKEFVQFSNGAIRPSSFVENPTFLAGYLLFSVFYSLIIFIEVKNKFWKYFSVLVFFLSILGIFITGTRGTILGLVFGFIAIFIYGILKGKNIYFGKLNFRTLSIVLVSFFVLFSVFFVVTRHDSVWQKVPGFSRVALVSNDDATTQTRLITAKLSLKAVNPMQNGLGKTLIGWGPENFSLAYGQYFDINQFKYEVDWLDRAHNKFLDVLVMNGVFGLIFYLTIWFLFFKCILKKKDFSLTNSAFIFIGVSFLIHLLFVFDQVTTSIPFFLVLAFIVYLSLDFDNLKFKKNFCFNKNKETCASIFFVALTLLSSFVFLRGDLFSYIQMREYHSIVGKGNASTIVNKINNVFEPFTVAQEMIRKDFLILVSNSYNGGNIVVNKLFDIALSKSEEYKTKRILDIKSLASLANVYNNKGLELNNGEFLKKSEFYFREALSFAPERPDFNYALALNLMYQKRFDESFVYFEKVFGVKDSLFLKNTKSIENVYPFFVEYFYKMKDKDNFIKIYNILKEYDPNRAQILSPVVQSLEKNNVWLNINFKVN